MQAIYAKGGAPLVLSLAHMSEAAGYIGKALYDSGLSAGDIDALIEVASQSDDARERDVAHGLIISAYRDEGKPWAEALIKRAKEESWSEAGLLTVLRALPSGRWTWDQVARIGGSTETSYWQKVPVYWMSEDAEVAKSKSSGSWRASLMLLEYVTSPTPKV